MNAGKAPTLVQGAASADAFGSQALDGFDSVSREEIVATIPAFLELYAERPIRDNQGGMRAPHLFATWFMVRKLAPRAIVESGVFKGLGTWLLEQAAPKARLVCMDPDPSARIYRSARAEYRTDDFSEVSWDLPREGTLLFFDDHQDELLRVRTAAKLGFRHLIFEDNYPVGRGDCYSLKQACSGEPPPTARDLTSRLTEKLRSALSRRDAIPPELCLLERYFEFPPVVRSATTRWGDPWSNERYPTPEALFTEEALPNAFKLFAAEAQFYTWICYAQLSAVR